MSNKKVLSQDEKEQLLKVLKARFELNMNRHQGMEWTDVQERLEANPEKLWSLQEMERTGGEPDVVAQKDGQFIFYDCAKERSEEHTSELQSRENLVCRH